MPRLVEFIDDLTNWYIRLNRARLKGQGSLSAETHVALSVLYDILITMSVLLSFSAPFFSEWLYQKLRGIHPAVASQDGAADSVGRAESVHFVMLPSYDSSRMHAAAEAGMSALRVVVELGRQARDRRAIALKQPLKEVVVVAAPEACSALGSLETYICDELNCWSLQLTSDGAAWTEYSAMINLKVCGKRLGKNLKSARAQVESLPSAVLEAQLRDPDRGIEICGQVLRGQDLIIKRSFAGDAQVYESASSSDFTVVCDIRQDQDVLEQTGLWRGVRREEQEWDLKPSCTPLAPSVPVQPSVS